MGQLIISGNIHSVHLEGTKTSRIFKQNDVKNNHSFIETSLGSHICPQKTTVPHLF